MHLTDDVLALLRQPSLCFLATTMADGSPQVTQTWVDTDGAHMLINSVQTHVKVRNIARDPRVAVAISDADDPSRSFQVRGRVREVTTANTGSGPLSGTGAPRCRPENGEGWGR